MERNTDDKQSFVNSYCVFIFKDKESNIRSIEKLTKHHVLVYVMIFCMQKRM